MKKIFLAFFIGLTAMTNGQTEKFNSEGKFFVGAELGANVIHKRVDNSIHPQIGISGEYYFAEKWSVWAKIKYHKAHLYYHLPEKKGASCGFGGFLCGLGSREEELMNFESYNIIIPVNLKWNYKISPSIIGYINGGFFVNMEMKSRRNGTDNVKLNHNKIYTSVNIGTGLSYQLKNSDFIYVDYHFYRGGSMIKEEQFLWDKYHYPKNSHISIGYSVNLKK